MQIITGSYILESLKLQIQAATSTKESFKTEHRSLKYSNYSATCRPIVQPLSILPYRSILEPPRQNSARQSEADHHFKAFVQICLSEAWQEWTNCKAKKPKRSSSAPATSGRCKPAGSAWTTPDPSPTSMTRASETPSKLYRFRCRLWPVSPSRFVNGLICYKEEVRYNRGGTGGVVCGTILCRNSRPEIRILGVQFSLNYFAFDLERQI